MSPQKDSSEYLLYSALSSNVTTDIHTWLIHSGASRHITRFSEHPSDLVEKDSSKQVIIGDDASYSMKGVGTSSLHLDSSISLQLNDVLFVPGIKRNLVSISALEDKGYQVAFSEGKVLLWTKNSNIKTGRVIGVIHECLYKLCTHPLQALVNDSLRLCDLWHRRLAHLHFRALPALPIMEKMVTGLPQFNQKHEGTCKGCALGRNTKGPFHSSESRSKCILDLIHSDLCGPMSVASSSGFLYYIIFIDDYSRKTWIYFLKSKESEEILERFKEFKAQVENFSGKRIEVLRYDNKGEYTHVSFRTFCIVVGIKREFS